MKNIIRNIVWIALVVVLAGCEIGQGELQKTKTGKLMYDAWSEDMWTLFNKIIEPAFNFNSWLTAPEAERDEILKEYFVGSTTISNEGGQKWKIESPNEEDILYITLVEGQSLYDDNCQIHVFYQTESENEPVLSSEFIISKEEGNSWSVHKEGDALHSLQLSWPQSAGILPSIKNSTFTIQGNGIFRHCSNYWNYQGEDYVQIQTQTDLLFDITEPVTCTLEENDMWWVWPSYAQIAQFKSGELTLKAEDGEGNFNIANITIIDEDKISVEIEGITQTWESDD